MLCCAAKGMPRAKGGTKRVTLHATQHAGMCVHATTALVFGFVVQEHWEHAARAGPHFSRNIWM